MNMSKWFLSIPLFLCLSLTVSGQTSTAEKRLVFGNAKMRLTLNYNGRACISSLLLNGAEVMDSTGVFSKIRTINDSFSTVKLNSDPELKQAGNKVTLSHILYGPVEETWTFTVGAADINFDIERKSSKSFLADQISLPRFQFKNINTWEGAYQDYGGLAWFYLFNKPLDTYGVYSNSSVFWNSQNDLGLQISVTAPGKQVAMDYTRTAEGKLVYNIGVADSAFVPRFDSATQRRMYIRDRTDVWSPVTMPAGSSRQSIELRYFSFKERYDRGKFKGVNGTQVSAVLNTVARIGVIGKQHFGGNSWHTPYGPLCLHEQYIAQMGLAINDSSYLNGYQDCLDFYRDHAMKPDGRVWPRWAYTNEDMMPGEVNDKGFYEAQWGYLLDANPDFVTNIAELYDQTGNKNWVKTHQISCEKALDWLMNRDSNRNGLVEMINDSYKQRRSSDWIDIVWASYENAFVNAKLYHALDLWSDIERQLGAPDMADRYAGFAANLKSSFNKSIHDGGFWDDEKKCYVYWREKDGSIHGDNMVTPVNFMAIGYGICTDPERKKAILDGIESTMEKEKLFFWPLCLTAYRKEEVNDTQMNFPEYENGDIFLSWGAIGVKAYADYKPELALKYVRNVMERYAQDGLAYQRYGREKQDGRGDDILSGNCLSVVGLYQAIYGINPIHNRFYLNPHLTEALNGTQISYNFRGEKLLIDLSANRYAVSNGRFRIAAARDFGFFHSGDTLQYFDGNDTAVALSAIVGKGMNLSLEVKSSASSRMIWSQSATGPGGAVAYLLPHMVPGTRYTVSIKGKLIKSAVANSNGLISFTLSARPVMEVITVQGG